MTNALFTTAQSCPTLQIQKVHFCHNSIQQLKYLNIKNRFAGIILDLVHFNNHYDICTTQN
jgi:hypothetical protein